MKNIHKCLLIIFSFTCLTACTVTSRQALDIQDKKNIQSNRIILNTTQREITMRTSSIFSSEDLDLDSPMDSGPIVRPNGGMNIGRGLLTVLIVEGIKYHRKNIAAPSMMRVKNTLKDFDFVNLFNTELQNRIGKLPWLKVKKQEVRYNLHLDEPESKILSTSNERTTLFIGTTYALACDFRQLEVSAYVKLVEKSVNGKEPRTLYSNNFYFVNRLRKISDKTNENHSQWINNNGDLLKSKLHEAAKVLTSMIVMDIENPNPKAYMSGKPITFNSCNGRMIGKLIKQQNNYNIVFSDINELYAVNTDYII